MNSYQKLITESLDSILLEQSKKEAMDLIKSLVPTGTVAFKSENSSRVVYVVKMAGAQRRNAVDIANSKIKSNSDLEIVAIAPSRQTKTFAFKFKDEKIVYEIQTKPDNKRTGGDPNELMTAACCFISGLKRKVPKTTVEMDVFIEEILTIINSGKIKDYNKSHIALMDADYDNCAQAISAAITIQDFIGGIPSSAYITGQTWNSDIVKFKRDAYGMKDFNSSDIVFKKGKTFYGISLKKKSLTTTDDPTLLNKSFVSLFDQSTPKYAKLVQKLEVSKEEFYASVIRDAIKDKVIEKFDFTNNEWNRYIGLVDNDYVNKKLKSDKSFFKDVYEIINKEKSHIADYLLKLILKIDLKELQQHDFSFALVTGIGRYLTSKGPVIEKGDIVTIDTITDKFESLLKSGKITMITTPGKKQGFEPDGNAAALYFSIKMGSLQILDIVLRYKGSFSSQPSFLATMTKEFKAFLK